MEKYPIEKTPEELKSEAIEIINFAIKESFFILEDGKADKIVTAWESFDTETKELILRLFKDVAAKLLSKKLNN